MDLTDGKRSIDIKTIHNNREMYVFLQMKKDCMKTFVSLFAIIPLHSCPHLQLKVEQQMALEI